MQLLKLFLSVFAFILAFNLQAQCPPGQREVKLQINTDYYWYEVHWQLRNVATGFVYATGSVPDSEPHEYVYCVPDEGCVEFKITDDNNDAMTPDGVYRLYYNGVLIRESIGVQYQGSESVIFGCPPGFSCASGIPVDTGSWATPNGMQTWYKFVPADTGIYEINTCSPLNACGSKIWVYGQCENIILTDNIVGADFYAEGGCPNGAAATVFLAGGQDYYIRLRSEPVDCDTAPIHFQIHYVGPITGCTDPLACNYDPLATISADCIYPGDPECPVGPDLIIRQDVLLQSLVFETEDNADPCYVEEGCIRGLGTRNVIKFITYIANIGEQDYHIGATPTNPNEPSSQFVWDLCHHHWHYVGYADYLLFDANGYRVPIGSKTGFCVLDLVCPPADSKYDCATMGITAGCADVYDLSTPCQWIDITDIPAGDYTMVVRVNWDKSPDLAGHIEKDYSNNWAQACFNLSYDGSLPNVTFSQDACPAYTDCLGEAFGDAQPDCNGVCQGPALYGDWNQDTLRNVTDTHGYLAAAIADTGDASHCLDLDESGNINVYDAALLQECATHANDPQYWVQEFPCQFPTGFKNTQDLVVIKPGAVDTLAKTFDIEINNPFYETMGYEFTVSGMHITAVENLAAGYHPDLRLNANTGEILALGLDESSIKKNALPSAFLRVHYDVITGLEFCIEKITAVVNKKYQLSSASLANPNCVQVKTSATNTPSGAFGVYVQPNPFTEKTNIFFENDAAEPMRIELWDVAGQRVKSFDQVRGTMVTFERNQLPAGVYYYSVSGSRGIVKGKIMAQ